MLVLLIPTSMVESIIYERESRQSEAINEVSSKWGLRQTISGPILVLPYEQTHRSSDSKEVFKETKYAYFLPDELRINGQVTPEKRHRGIFDVVLYGSQLTLEGAFNQPVVQKLIPASATVLWDKAILVLGIPDLRGLEDHPVEHISRRQEYRLTGLEGIRRRDCVAIDGPESTTQRG